MNRILRKIGLALLLAMVAGVAAFGQTDVAAVALYNGADRAQRLLDAAKKEGSVSLYAAIAAADVEKITRDFEGKYGVKLNIWRAGADKVLQRALAEAKSGRPEFDLVHISSLEMEALHREKLLQEVNSPHFQDLIAGAVPRHREWAAAMMHVTVQAYNTDKVKKDELPKTYKDLLDPKWKGRLGIEAKNQEWFYTIVKEMGEESGLKFFKELVRGNGLSVRYGRSVLNNLTVAGEVPLALTVYHYMPEQAKRKGAPIDWFVIEPAIARLYGTGISKKAPHPNAAVLFYDYLISDAQGLLAELQYVPVSKKIASPLKSVPIKLVDPAIDLDEVQKWEKLYEDIVIKQAR